MRKSATYPHVVCTPGTCGGRPRIEGHRITVSDIVVWYERLGMSADDIATAYDLTPADVHAALAYYFDHTREIDSDLADADSLARRLRRSNPSLLKKRLRG